MPATIEAPTVIAAELRPKVVWAKSGTSRYALKMRLDVMVGGRIYQTFGAKTAPYHTREQAIAEAKRVLKSGQAWFTCGVREAFEASLEELEN